LPNRQKQQNDRLPEDPKVVSVGRPLTHEKPEIINIKQSV